MTAVVHLDLRVDPAKLDTLPALLNEILVATRAWPGNEGLEVIVDEADPAHVIVVELWTSTADHDAYAAWRATPEGVSGLGAVLAAPPVKTVFAERIPLAF